MRFTAISLGLALAVAVPALADSSPNMTGKRELKMAHCPSAVRGAKTQVSDRKDGVELTVTASNPTAWLRIFADVAEIAQINRNAIVRGN